MTSNYFTLVVNAGRSGSTFLAHLLRSNFPDKYVAPEDLSAKQTQPRRYNRAYEESRINNILKDENLEHQISIWKSKLSESSVIETGWTCYHLLPVLHNVFGEKFRYVILHRNPISVALSRASMGNYHPKSFYENSHEVCPFDEFSIAPDYKSRWLEMNHFEKCLYWWYVTYLEAEEFHEKHPEVPCFTISTSDLFRLNEIDSLLEFFGVYGQLNDTYAPKNEREKHAQESFPVKNEWRRFNSHPRILRFAERMGYAFDKVEIEKEAAKYFLPKGFGPMLRHSLNYWHFRSKLKKLLRKSEA